jgi:anti-anti-sigma regulatory factor
MEHTNLLSFPRVIDFTIAAEYIEVISKDISAGDLIIDLEYTEIINSSFIGLLIYLKDHLQRNGGKLIVKISPSIEKTLRRLNLYDYFIENQSAPEHSMHSIATIN